MYKCEKCNKKISKEEYFKNKGFCNECEELIVTDTKCPNCGSLAVTKTKSWALGCMLLMLNLILAFIPFLWIVIPFTGLLGIGLIIYSPFNKVYGCTCRSCKYTWKYSKK